MLCTKTLEEATKTTIHSNKLGLKFLNETATMVFDLCTGYNTIEYICDEMQSRFPDVSSDIIRSDVEEIIYYLRDLGLISIDDFERPLGCDIRIARNDDFRAIKNFVSNCLDDDKSYPASSNLFVSRDKEWYNEYLLRERQFSFGEINLINVKEGKIHDIYVPLDFLQIKQASLVGFSIKNKKRTNRPSKTVYAHKQISLIRPPHE